MNLENLAPPVLIETAEGFDALLDDLNRQPSLAVDTESNSLHAYRERVCLIQFSTPKTDYLLDPLALDDLNPLGPVFENPRIEKVFHAAEYDLICLRRDFGFGFSNLFDTMQAGRILGRKQAGLDRLLEDKFGVKIDKRFQKADWGVRPLSRNLMLYARLDTHFLLPLRELLQAELERKGLWPLAQEDFRMACYANGTKSKPESLPWERYRSRRDLTPRDLTVLKELMTLREQIAAGLDRPPFKVIGDERLIEIARIKPADKDVLTEIGLTSRQLKQWGAPILEAVARGQKSPLVRRKPSERPDEAYLKRLDKLKTWRKKAAAEMDVESDVVLPRSLLLALAERGPRELHSIMEPSPWRLKHFGAQILNVLGG